MKTTLLRAGALSCALLASTALVSPAQAQDLPRFNQVDRNGVDLVTGDYFFSMVEGSIGLGEGALTLQRNWAGDSGWTDNWTGALYQNGFEIFVEFGTYADTFTYTSPPLTFHSTKGDGATLELLPDGDYRYRSRDGTTIIFSTADPSNGEADYGGPACARGGEPCSIPVQVQRPDGMTYDLDWDIESRVDTNGWTAYPRLRGVTNSANYSFTIDYATNTPGSGVPVANWFLRTGATFTNLDSAPGTLPTVSYARPSAGVTEVTDTGGEVWRLTETSGALTGIRRPGAGSDTTTIAYSSGQVSSVTNEGVATSYAFGVSGSTGTATVTDANSQVTTIVSDLDDGRPTSVTDPLSRTTSFQYDGDSRLTRTTRPEGNYVDYSYDGRGNLTEVRAVAKSGSGLPDMVTTAAYDSTCSNAVTCNQPNSVTDARGFRTDYTYDSTHGGVLTATQPAPSGSAPVGSGDRPQTRYSYTQVTAVSGQPVYMLTGVSACASGTVASSCVGTTAESRAVIAYDTDNLRTTSVTARNGDNSISATSAYSYDAIGNALTVDGPLSGSADTTRYRYDAARRVIGVVGPDPDGGGSLKHRAVRATYTNGLPIRVEQGNVDSQSDGDWAAFAPLQKIEQDYDANARPTVQRLMSGSTTYQLTQTSYDGLGRVRCVAQRMNPAEFGSLPSDACTLDTQGTGANDFGPDRIARTTYDAAGQMTKVETGYGVSGVTADEMTMTYRANGQVETVTDANGNLTTWVYDGHDRLSRTRMPHPSTTGTSSTTDYEELTYATATVGGNSVATPLVSSRRLRDGNSIGYSYDNLNRLAAKDLPGTAQDPAYGYDLLGRMTSSSLPSYAIAYTWDALGRNLTEVNGLGTLTYSWDAAGRRTQVHNGSFYIDYVYDTAGGMTEVRENGATSGAGLLAVYGYDDLGRRVSLTRGNGTSTGYGYDAVSRLTQLTQNLNGSGSDLTLDFTHNPAGEIATNTRSNDAYAYTGHANTNIATTVDGLNRVTAIGGTSVSHGDGRGNVTAIGAAGYTYDSENRLQTGPNSGAYAHDALGRIYYGGGASALYLQPEDDRIAAEIAPGGAIQARYVYGVGVDEPLVWYDGGGTSTRRWFHADERGSVIAVSDASGDVVTAVNRYDEYGNVQGTLTGRFGYTGQAWLPEAGLYHYRARAYNPALGRFMQTDPIGYEGGMNLYAYVGNNPVNFVDPTGLEQICYTLRRGGFVTDDAIWGRRDISVCHDYTPPTLQPGPLAESPLVANCLTADCSEISITGRRKPACVDEAGIVSSSRRGSDFPLFGDVWAINVEFVGAQAGGAAGVAHGTWTDLHSGASGRFTTRYYGYGVNGGGASVVITNFSDLSAFSGWSTGAAGAAGAFGLGGSESDSGGWGHSVSLGFRTPNLTFTRSYTTIDSGLPRC